MERRKLKITLSLAVLIPCVLYIAGIIAQFMININAWKAAGSDYSVSQVSHPWSLQMSFDPYSTFQKA